MYTVSNQFRTAMNNGNPQRVLLAFSDTFFSNEDVSASTDLTMTEQFVSETDLTIGLCPSTELRFDLLNDDYHLSEFQFGRFTAYLGVQSDTYAASDYVKAFTEHGVSRNYIFIPLGVFIASRPDVVRKQIISVTANDQMVLFDRDWPTGEFTFPCTMASLLREMCEFLGVTCTSYEFMNSTLSLSEEPEAFANATMREVLGWIAEAAGSIARFNRDGNLELAWFNYTNVTFDEHDYSEFSPAWFEVAPIDKLHIRNADSTAEAVLGSGTNSYMIQNNPFLRQDDSAAVAPSVNPSSLRGTPSLKAASVSPAQQVFNRLTNAPNYHPAAAELFTDWTMQAGDVVTVRSDNDSYSLPIYQLDLKWNGASKVTVESTGNEKRKPLPALARQQYASGSGGYRRQKEEDAQFQEFATWKTQTDELIGQYAAQYAEDQQALDGRITIAETSITQSASDITLAASAMGILVDQNGRPVRDANGHYIYDPNAENVSLTARINLNASAITQEVTDRTNADTTLSGRITTEAGKITAEVTRATEAEEALAGRVTITENAITQEVTDRTNADTTLSGRITTEANKISTIVQNVGANGEVTAASIVAAINNAGSSIVISADHIELNGNTIATELEGYSIRCGALTVEGVTDFLRGVYSEDWVGSDEGFVGPDVVIGDQSLKAAIIGFGTASSSNGRISIPTTTAGGTAGPNINFNIADTQFYQDQVSAMKTAVRNALGTAKWNQSASTSIYATLDTVNKKLTVNRALTTLQYPGDSNPTEIAIGLGELDLSTPLTTYYNAAVASGYSDGWDAARDEVVIPSAGTDTSFEVKVPSATQDEQQTLTFSITKGATPGSTGYAAVSLSGTVVGRISIGNWYDAGVTAGAAGVTLSASGWTGPSGKNTVTASNGESVEISLPSFTTSGGTSFSSHKTTVYFSTASVTSGAVASKTVDATSEYNSGYSAGWTAARGQVDPPAAGTETTFSFKVPSATEGEQSSYTYTLSKGTPSADGGYVSVSRSGTVVARISITNWWTKGYEAGEAAVTLGSPTWGSTTTNANNTFTVTASNDESKSQALYLTKGSWSSGSMIVYLRTTSTTGTIRARTTISMPDEGTWAWSNPAQGYARASFTINGKTYSNSKQIPSNWM